MFKKNKNLIGDVYVKCIKYEHIVFIILLNINMCIISVHCSVCLKIKFCKTKREDIGQWL